MNRYQKSYQEWPEPWIKFETTEDLLKLDTVKTFFDRPDARPFLSASHLMVTYDNGFEWWVLGRIENPAEVNLPKWPGGKYRARLEDGTETVLGREVVMSCGDELTLYDGSKATWLRR